MTDWDSAGCSYRYSDYSEYWLLEQKLTDGMS